MTGSKLPFDLTRLDFKGKRKKLRKRLVLYAAVPFVIVAIICIKLSTVVLFHHLADLSYKNRDYENALNLYKVNLTVNVIEPHKAPYAVGTSQLQLGKYDEAIASLRSALLLGVPKAEECQVRVNLVLALIAKADKLAATKNFQKAVIVYDEARAAIEARDCGISNDEAAVSDVVSTADKALQDMLRQLVKKQNDAKKASNGDKTGGQEVPNDTGNPDDASDSQIETLQKQNKDNRAETQKDAEQSRGSRDAFSQDRNFDAKNW